MKKIFNEGNQIHNFMSSSGSGTDFLTSYGSDYGSGSTSKKVTVPTVPVPVPQRWFRIHESLPLYYRSESCSFFSGFEDARKNS